LHDSRPSSKPQERIEKRYEIGSIHRIERGSGFERPGASALNGLDTHAECHDLTATRIETMPGNGLEISEVKGLRLR
jgi:hypothetical protein